MLGRKHCKTIGWLFEQQGQGSCVWEFPFTFLQGFQKKLSYLICVSSLHFSNLPLSPRKKPSLAQIN